MNRYVLDAIFWIVLLAAIGNVVGAMVKVASKMKGKP